MANKSPFLLGAHSLEEFKREVSSYSTFETNGVEEGDARRFLGSPQGLRYQELLLEAYPHLGISKINKLAREHVMSGRIVPTPEVITEPLVKIVVPGTKPSDHTPYFAKLSDLEGLLASGESLSNKLGLPIASESRYYDVYAIYPKGAVEVFASEVAPTSELDGRWQKEGGARQYLVPNRHQFSEPVLERRLADHISLRHAVPPLELPPALSPSMRTLGRVAVAAELLDTAQTARDVAGHCCGRTSAALLTS